MAFAAANGGMRSISLLLALQLLLSCDKVSAPEPSALPDGAARDASAGHTELGGFSAGGVGGNLGTNPRDAGEPTSDAGKLAQQSDADGGNPDTATLIGPLCDGSDMMRLTYVSDGGGPLPPTFGFTNPHGHAYLAIDGTCHYYSASDYMHGVSSGTLTAAQADQLSADLHWTDLEAWAAYGLNTDAGCSDAGVVGLMKANAAAGCSCGCDPAAPSGLSDALQRAYEWVQELTTVGKPLDGPVSAVILEASLGMGHDQPVFDWPLSRSIDSVPNLLLDQSDARLWMGTGPWATFDAAADYTKLRQMRTATANSDNAGSGYVSGAVRLRVNGMDYDLFVRDELPAGVERAWRELKASVPSN